MRIGIAGSAGVEGITETPGIVNGNGNPVVKRAMFIWIGALAVLVLFHVGGSRA